MEDIWCVKPLRKNQRIIKQDGYFLLFGINGNKINPAKFSHHPIDVERWEIDYKSKRTILNQLELLGISRDKLFPELDETAKYLKDNYKHTSGIICHCT